MADIVLFDKNDAKVFCKSLGHEVDEKHLETRFMYLEEFALNKYKPHRIGIFIDCFNHLTVIVQENKSSLILFNKEYRFNIGFKMEYFKIFLSNSEYLKSAIFGAFLSRIILKESFDQSFEAAESTFKKLLDCYVNNPNELPEDEDYFLFKKMKEKPKFNSISNYGQIKAVNSLSSRESGMANSLNSNEQNYDISLDNSYNIRSLQNNSNDARFNKVLENNLKSSLEVDNILTANIRKREQSKSNRFKIIKLPQGEQLKNKLMYINDSRHQSLQIKHKKKLSPLNSNIYARNNYKHFNSQETMNLNNMMSKMNYGLNQNNSISSNKKE